MELSQGNKSLFDMVKRSYSGEVMLPDFQRNFVWSKYDIEELMKSLLEKMFIGNFLIHNVDPLKPPFKPIAIEGAKLVNPGFQEKPSILILDGQQRITSLFYAIYSPNIPLKYASTPYAFFISISELIKDNIEDCVFSVSKKTRYFKSMLTDGEKFNFEVLRKEQIIPVSLLKEDITAIWYDHYRDLYNSDDEKKIRSYLKNITDYQILTLDVPLNESPGNIAVLFERINRTGIKLSIFDLLVARLYKFLNLREEWEKSIDSNERIKKLAQNNKRDTQIPYYFIQALALHNGQSVKARDMLNIDDKILNQKNWLALIETIEKKALVRLLDINEFGIGNVSKWFPYSTMLPTLIATFLSQDYDYQKVKYWYWSSVFSERYAGSIDSKMIKDYKELSNWFDSEKATPESIEAFFNTLNGNFSLYEKENSGNAAYKGVFNLLFMNDAKDFYVNDKIKFTLDELDDHHIFPKKFLEDKNVNKNVNSVLNKTLISASTNRSINKKSPAQYVQGMIERHGDIDKVYDIFASHFISREMVQLLLKVSNELSEELVNEYFRTFIDLRNNMLLNQIHILVGHKSSSSPQT